MKKRLLILPLLAGLALASCEMPWSKKEETPGETPSGETASVVSVSVSSPKGKVYTTTEAFTLTATVQVTGNASKNVEWASSDTAVATVTAGGKVTPVAPGSVTITAKSTFDTTKSGSVSFTVFDAGYAGGLIAEGYDFVSAWPAAEIKALIGVDGFVINDTKGFYLDSGETESGIKYVAVACDYSEANGAQIEAAVENFGYYFDSYNDLNCFIDPTISYEVDIYQTYADEEETQPVYMFDFYLSTSYFEGSKENTTDTAWNSTVAANIAKISADFSLPFVKLGAGYASEYDDGELVIYDQSPDYKKLDGYGDLLVDFEKVEEDDYVYYKKDLDKYSFAAVEFGFQSEYGNTISVTVYLSELEEYPADEVASFVDAIPSKYEVAGFVSEKGTYTYQESSIKVGEDERDCVLIGVAGATKSECLTFIETLVADEYEIIQNNTDEEAAEGYNYVVLQKGKIVVKAEMSFVREATEAELEEFMAYIDSLTDEEFENISDEDFYKYFEVMFTGTFSVLDLDGDPSAQLTVYGDPSGIEVRGVYIFEETATIPLEATYQIHVKKVEIESTENLVFASSDESIATVDANGLVTAKTTEGKATITVTVEGTELSDSIEINVAAIVPFENKVAFNDTTCTNEQVITSVDLESGAKIAFSKGTGSTDPKYYSNGTALRVYAKGTITVTAPENGTLSSIKFTAVTNGEVGSIVPSVGSIDSNLVWTAPDDKTTSVTFTIGGTKGHYRISEMTVSGLTRAN